VTQDTHHHRWMVIRYKLNLTSYVLSAETGEAALRRRSDIRLKEKPNLVGLEGYLRTGERAVDKGAPPWRIRELK
jgi:hypothetical protein